MSKIMIVGASRLGRAGLIAAMAAELLAQGHSLEVADEGHPTNGFEDGLQRIADQLRKASPAKIQPAYYQPKRNAQWKHEVPRHLQRRR